MLEWLQNIANTVFSGLNSLRDWTMRAIAAVYSYISARVTSVIQDINNLAHYINVYIGAVEKYIGDVYNYAVYTVEQIIPNITHWVQAQLVNLGNFVRSIYDNLAARIEFVLKLAEAFTESVRDWIIKEIIQPIKDFVGGLYAWVTENIGKLLNYFAHPELIAQLIGGWLWRSWLSLLHQYGRPVARWLFAHMLSMAVEAASLIEEMITALI